MQHLAIYVMPQRSRVLMDVSVKTLNTFGGGYVVHDGPNARPAVKRTAVRRRGAD